MIVPMKKVLVAGRPADREMLLNLLQQAGVIHVEPVSGKPEISPDVVREISRIEKARDILSQVPVPSDGMAPPGTPSRLVKEIHSTAERLAAVETELVSLDREREAVTPWGTIPQQDMELIRRQGFVIDLFVLPPGLELSELAVDCLEVVSVSPDGRTYVIAVSRKSPPPPPGASKLEVPARDLPTVQALIQERRQEQKTLQEILKQQAKRLPDLEQHLQERLERKDYLEAEAGLYHEEQLFILQGWLPADHQQVLTEALDRAKIPAGLTFEEPTEDMQPPTKLDNPWWCKPVEYLYDFLGVMPGYREADISPAFFPAMVIFAGMLIADAGYGLIAFLALALSYGRLTAAGTPRNLLHLGMSMMAGVTIYGAFTNTWFGEPPPELMRLTSLDGSNPEHIKFLQNLCFFLGAAHMTVAHAWKGYRRAPYGAHSLADLGWILFTWAMYALVCMLILQKPTPFYMKPFFVVSVVLILFFTEPSWNLFRAIGSGLGDLAMNLTAFFSDIISYIRLWAVGLAGGVIAQSFNELARPLPLLACVLVLLVAHSLNFILGVIAVLAHGVRLNLLEFSNHIGMEWTGREYQPFRKR
jgi:V/A-type H+-transporting ATPase subunit I